MEFIKHVPNDIIDRSLENSRSTGQPKKQH